MNENKIYKCKTCDKCYTEPSGRSKHYNNYPDHRNCQVNQDMSELYEENQLQRKRIHDLEDELELLKQKYFQCQTELATSKQKFEKAHLALYNKPICEKVSSFSQAWGNKLNQFCSQKTKDFWNATWHSYTKENVEITVETANSFLSKLKCKASTRNKKKKVLETTLSLFLDENVKLKFFAPELPKPKHILSNEEVLDFLEYLRWQVDLNKKTCSRYVAYFFLCACLIKYGMRFWELSGLLPKSVNQADGHIIVMDSKNKYRPKKYKLSKNILDYIASEGNKKHDNEAIFGADAKTIARLMKVSPIFQAVDTKKYSLGPHCFRVTKFNQSFNDSFQAALEETKQVSLHGSRASLLHYVGKKFENPVVDRCLTNLEDIGKIVHTSTVIPDLEANFRHSVEYKNATLKYDIDICSDCYHIINENAIGCGKCQNKFHQQCRFTLEPTLCQSCYYLSKYGYKLRLHLMEVTSTCRFCQKKDTSLCSTCNKKMKLRIPKKDMKKLVDANKFSAPVSYNPAYCLQSLEDALKKQGLAFYKDLHYFNHENDNNASNAPQYIAISVKNREMIVKSPIPPVAVTHEKNMGYVAFAVAPIPKNTYICQYLGDAYLEKDVPQIYNDSKIMMLDAGTTRKNLIICHINGANLAKYISGYYDDNLCNIYVHTYAIDNKISLCIFTSEDIEENEILYYNYGGTADMSDYVYKKFITKAGE